MEGGGGVLAVELGQALDEDDTTITVASTTDYKSTDYVYIDNEKILYTGKTSTTFTGCTRGVDGTEAESHDARAMVYTTGASVVNDSLGFNVMAEADSYGWWAAIAIPWKLLTTTLPHIVVMNYSFLTGTLGIIGYFLMAMAAGLILVIVLQLAGAIRV